jgi:hypothetical protein
MELATRGASYRRFGLGAPLTVRRSTQLQGKRQVRREGSRVAGPVRVPPHRQSQRRDEGSRPGFPSPTRLRDHDAERSGVRGSQTVSHFDREEVGARFAR